MKALGFSGLPVKFAGHACWQRPHSVHVNPSRRSFQPRSWSDRSPNVAVRDGRWKLLVNADGSRPELYDLAADPKETANLAERQPDLARRLIDQALAWRKSLP